MVVTKITEDLERRKTELVEMLENNRDSMELEKQHQVYGAINEINLFLQTFEYYQNNTSEKDMKPIRLVKAPEEQKPFFTKLFEDIKGKVLRNK